MSESTFIKKIKTESIVQQVINSLTDAIVNKELLPGDRLPSEPEMAVEFGVARSSIREAVKILAYLGILESRRAEGTFVSTGFKESMIDPMIYGIFLSGTDDFEHLMEIRQMIEVGMVRLAIKNQDEEGLALLKDKLLAMEAVVHSDETYEEKFEKFFTADNDFHDTLALICKNPLADKLNRIVRTLTHSIRHDTVISMLRTGKAQDLIDAHWEIYRMIADQNLGDLDEMILRTYFLDFLTHSPASESGESARQK